MIKKIITIICICLISSSVGAIDYDAWDTLLNQYTAQVEISGIKLVGVDYEGLKKDKRFEKLISLFEEIDSSRLVSSTDKMAFWINAYNIFAIKLVIDNYPLTSIQEAGDVFHPIEKQPIANIGGKTYSLSDIKHKVLRQQFNEPLIHTALVDTSLSGPSLRQESFRPKKLKQQLREQMQDYLKNPAKGFKLERDEKTLYLSLLFTLDAEDFKEWGGIINFVAKFIPASEKNFLDNNRYKVKYFDYNWGLNLWTK